MDVMIVLAVALGCSGVALVLVWLKGGFGSSGGVNRQSDEMVALRCEVEGLRSTISAQSTQLEQARREREQMEERRLDEQAKALSVVDQVRREMTEAVNRLQDEKGTAQRQVATLASNLQAEQHRVEELERLRGDLRRELSERDAALRHAAAELSLAKEQNATLQQRCIELAKREGELAQAQDFIQQMQIAFREKSERVATLETQLEQQSRAADEKNAMHQELHARTVDELEKAKQERTAVASELTTLRGRTAAQAERIAELEKREVELREVRQKCERIQAALTEKSERVSTLETQLVQQKRASDDKLADQHERCTRLTAELSSASAELKNVAGELSIAKQQGAAQQQRLKELEKREQELGEVRARYEVLQGELLRASERVVGLEAELAQERQNADAQLGLHKELHAQLEERFKGLAAQVLERNTEKFEQGTKVRLHEMAEVLGKQVRELQQKVEQTHSQDVQDRVALRTELQKMIDTSKRIDADAANLARALTGDRKAQGAWGELILDRILEQCGLKEGVEYRKQAVLTDDEQRKFRPDVIVNLPGRRSVVVDAKVSLTAYNEYVSAESGEAAQLAVQRHVASVRNHMKGLSEKDYWRLNGLKTGDYVLMFLPIESAFAEALRHEPGLFEEAFQQQIILTSPATLLATLRTIEHTWRVERQNETARSIVEQAGKLYDKMVGFVEDLRKVGSTLDAAQRAYDGALSKLSTGKGNLVGQADKLRELGVKLKKVLPDELVDQARAELLPRAVEGDNDNGMMPAEPASVETVA